MSTEGNIKDVNESNITSLEILEDDSFAGYRVRWRGESELSGANKHQIQQVAMMLNAYETFK